MILKDLTKKLLNYRNHHCSKFLMSHMTLKNHPSLTFNFSKIKIRQVKNQNKTKENQQVNEFSSNYMKINLNTKSSKTGTLNASVLINLKVTFPQQGNKQTKIIKVQSHQESNQPCVIMALDKSQFPPQANKANQEIQRFWNQILDSNNFKISSSCAIVSGKTNKRKNLAFSFEFRQTNGSLKDIHDKFEEFLKSCI